MSEFTFSQRLIRWQKQYGRHHLPWLVRQPYNIWLSEIMLQQTQVATVLDYYPRFIARFPTIEKLAAAPQDEVLSLWAGLGYYSRARNLHKAAQQIMNEFNGTFPQQRRELEKLCGIGRSTAAAISAFAFKQRETILDGNVKRVLCRIFALAGNPNDKKFEHRLWSLAESLLPECTEDMPAYTQGLMDLGATICRRSKPLCMQCPMLGMCQANIQNRVNELPYRKTAVQVQTLPMFWLVLRNAKGSLWLEKRPQKGIWGSLYCVPCFENLSSLHQAAARFSVDAGSLIEHTAFTHRLTHRLLLITPLSAVIRPVLSENNTNGIWAEQSAWADYALPKPLSLFIQTKFKAV